MGNLNNSTMLCCTENPLVWKFKPEKGKYLAVIANCCTVIMHFRRIREEIATKMRARVYLSFNLHY